MFITSIKLVGCAELSFVVMPHGSDKVYPTIQSVTLGEEEDILLFNIQANFEMIQFKEHQY
jgi:hypothetical protein